MLWLTPPLPHSVPLPLPGVPAGEFAFAQTGGSPPPSPALVCRGALTGLTFLVLFFLISFIFRTVLGLEKNWEDSRESSHLPSPSVSYYGHVSKEIHVLPLQLTN